MDDTCLTDTQVIRILETRGPTGSSAVRDAAQVAVLKPEDTSTRGALRAAVASGAPVSFAVQLCWSVQAIDLGCVPSLAIFRAYTLYSTESCREGRSCHFLRLGFFRDAISAKQVALHVRSSFASAAVVPVTESELTHAGETRIDTRRLGDVQDDAHESSRRAGRRARPQKGVVATASGPGSAIDSDSPLDHSSRKSEETIEQTLEMLAASEIWTDENSLSKTGVRHLAITVEKRRSRRS